MGNVVGNLAQVWRQAGPAHKAMLIGIVAAFAVVAVLLLRWASQPDYALLYSGLSPDDAAKIEEKLRDEDIPCQIKNGGSTILVPAEKVHTLRLSMVREGLPTGGNQGYGILDNGELGQSPFKETINYIRAIEGELVKTIKLIEGVATARVHVVNEQHSVFARGQKESSATVVIKTSGGAALKAENVTAITSLVAGAVKGVTPDKVVVVVNGKLLSSRQGENDLMSMGSTLFESKMKIESYYAQKAETMLATVLGAGRATVKVDATLATTSIQSTQTTFDIKNQAQTRSKTVENSKTTTAKSKGGNSSPTGVSEDEKSEEVDYMTPTTVVRKAETPGKIESLAAAVFVDLSALSGGEAKEGEESKTASLTTERIREAVGNALGLEKTKWADAITVVNVPFQTAAVAEETPAEAPNMMSMVLRYTKDFSLGIAVLGVLLVFKIMRGKKASTSEPTEESSTATMETATAGAGPRGGGGRQLTGPDKQLRTKIVNALSNNPDQVKKLFLSWVESDGGK